MKLNKSLGQNFLKDVNIVNTMIDALGIKDQETLIEIGPGLGAITKTLIQNLKIRSFKNKLYAIEYDERFLPKLNTLKADNENIEIIHANVLDWLPQLPNATHNTPIKIIGAIPYNITSPIIHKITYMQSLPTKTVLLIQKEVAEKVYNTEPNASYMSTFVQTFFDVELKDIVPATSFDPIPKVDSQIITFTRRPQQEQKITHEEKHAYEGFLHKAFSNPRKMLNKVFTKEELALFNIDPQKRPQEINVEKWTKAFTTLKN